MNLKINHRAGKHPVVNVKYFNKFTLNLKYDDISSSFGFDFLFDPTNREHAELACVSHFHEATVEHNGEVLVTGFILSQGFTDEPKDQMVRIGGYSKAGVMGDCEIPTKSYPLQSDGLSLKQICEKYANLFHLKVKAEENAIAKTSNQKIEKSTAKESQNIKSYLTELCVQRDIVLTHNELGDLLLTKAKTKQKPILDFDGGGLPGTKMEMIFNGQGIHSHITVIKEASAEGGNAGEYTIRNPFCPVAHVYRPRVVVQNSGDDISIEKFAKQQLAAELKNITLVIETDRWEVEGKIIKPNNIITVKNPKLFLYNKTRWFIESISFVGDETKTTATLNCVLPEVYNGEIPKNVFVDVHQNLPRF